MSTETEKLLSPDEAKEKAAQAKKRVTTEILANPKKEKPVNDRVKAVIENADKQEKLEKQQAKDKDKKLSKEDKAINKAKKKVEEAKKKLEEAKAKNNEKAIKKAEKAPEKAKKDLEKAKKAKQEKEKLNLKETAKRTQKVEADLDKAGVKKKEAPKKDKDDKSKGKDTENKKSPEQKKQEEMQKKYPQKELPGGMIIKQEGPSWKLYSPDMKRSKDVTHQVESLIKTNKEIDAVNENIDKNNKMKQSQVGNADLGKGNDAQVRDPKRVDTMEENTAMGISTGQMRVADPEKGMTEMPQSVPDVKITDINNKELSPDATKALAKFCVDMALSDKDIENLKEKDREQKNEQDRAKKFALQREGR